MAVFGNAAWANESLEGSPEAITEYGLCKQVHYVQISTLV